MAFVPDPERWLVGGGGAGGRGSRDGREGEERQ